MRVHHLCVATMCPLGGRLVNRRGHMVCHALLLELPDTLVLVETGLGTDDVARPERLGPARWVAGFRMDPAGTAVARIRALGFDPRDVGHVLLTHLDVDHAGGLADFPRATVHVHEAELAAARHPTGLQTTRYRPVQWAHGPRWAPAAAAGEPWFGFEAVRDLPGLPPEVLLVPLPGHSPGHCAVAVDRGDRWLLHCGDAYYHTDEVHGARAHAPLALEAFQWVVEHDRATRRHNLDRLRSLARDAREGAAPIDIFCAHDPDELERYTA